MLFRMLVRNFDPADFAAADVHLFSRLLVHNTTIYILTAQEYEEPSTVSHLHFTSVLCSSDLVCHSRCFDRKMDYKKLLIPVVRPNNTCFDFDFKWVSAALPVCTPLTLSALLASHGQGAAVLD